MQNKNFLKIVKAGMCGICDELESPDWDYLYTLAETQSLIGIYYHGCIQQQVRSKKAQHFRSHGQKNQRGIFRAQKGDVALLSQGAQVHGRSARGRCGVPCGRYGNKLRPRRAFNPRNRSRRRVSL